MTAASRSAILIAALAVSGCGEVRGTSHSFEGATMGTRYLVRVDNTELDHDAEGVHAAIRERLARIDRAMSTYRADSELSRLNRHASTEPFALSVETFQVLRRAQELGRETDGAFDVTVGALVSAWGFGIEERPPTAPPAEVLERLRRSVGYGLLELDASASTVRKADSAVTVDLSAIAKGFAVDVIAAWLRAEGYADFMVEVGGEVRTSGRNRDGEAWRIGIERPGDGAPGLQLAVSLADLAMATSGDYRNSYELDGRRISHGIDPRTGMPADHAGASVTVVAETCMDADAIATALMVMGPAEGFDWAREHQVAALFLVRDGERTAERASPEFERMTRKPANPRRR